MPAMLKGYIDRVFTEGFAYRVTDDGMQGSLWEKGFSLHHHGRFP